MKFCPGFFDKSIERVIMVVEAKGGTFGGAVVRIGRSGGLGGIIKRYQGRWLFGRVKEIPMKKLLADLSIDQKDRLAEKLQYLKDMDISNRALQDAESLEHLYQRAYEQIDHLFSPAAVAFIRNLGPKLTVDTSFRLQAADKALSISSPTSPAVYSIAKGLSVYVVDFKNGPIIFANRSDDIFQATDEKPSIKISGALQGEYKSLAVVPIWKKDDDVPLGGMGILWKEAGPIKYSDYLIGLKTLRLLGGFVAPTLFELIVRQNIKELPPGIQL